MPRKPASFAVRVYHLVRRVPPGRIVSYGAVAALLGKPRAARAVGQALRALPDDNDVPWWRVVNRNGAVSARPVINAKPLQMALLRKERVRFNAEGCADWKKFGWDGIVDDPVEQRSPQSHRGHRGTATKKN